MIEFIFFSVLVLFFAIGYAKVSKKIDEIRVDIRHNKDLYYQREERREQSRRDRAIYAAWEQERSREARELGQ